MCNSDSESFRLFDSCPYCSYRIIFVKSRVIMVMKESTLTELISVKCPVSTQRTVAGAGLEECEADTNRCHSTWNIIKMSPQQDQKPQRITEKAGQSTILQTNALGMKEEQKSELMWRLYDLLLPLPLIQAAHLF